MSEEIFSYDDTKNKKSYQLCYNYETMQVKITDGSFNFITDFTEEMPVGNLITAFENFVDETMENALRPVDTIEND